jgi:hypothetical protein
VETIGDDPAYGRDTRRWGGGRRRSLRASDDGAERGHDWNEWKTLEHSVKLMDEASGNTKGR